MIARRHPQQEAGTLSAGRVQRSSTSGGCCCFPIRCKLKFVNQLTAIVSQLASLVCKVMLAALLLQTAQSTPSKQHCQLTRLTGLTGCANLWWPVQREHLMSWLCCLTSLISQTASTTQTAWRVLWHHQSAISCKYLARICVGLRCM